jgi:asparagine synthase (glutamine-hydrolysing)
MAFGLENRSPFLDHLLYEHVAKLPASRRTALHRTKALLKRLARGRIPDSLLAARKQGFGLPLHAWLPGPLAPWLDDLVGNAQAVAPAFREGALRSELDAYRHGRSDPLAPYRLWTLAVLEFWAREFSVEVAG